VLIIGLKLITASALCERTRYSDRRLLVSSCRRRQSRLNHSTFVHPEKDILNSRIVIPKIQPRKFCLATRFLSLKQKCYSWDNNFFGARIFSTYFRKNNFCSKKKNSCSKNKILVARIKLLLQKKYSCLFFLRIIILESRISYFLNVIKGKSVVLKKGLNM